jgi:hypothetical protein
MTTKMPPPALRPTVLLTDHSTPHFDRVAAALELRRELARVERGLVTGAFSQERDELLLALQRLDDGTYGLCLECARQIPRERLEVMPATRWCVHCAR